MSSSRQSRINTDEGSSSRRQNEATSETSARLPPRSRTGCWTCRRRKVKCDEGRPICGQCSRLQQVCDYGPRLTWRNETPRCIEKLVDMKLGGCPAWDVNANVPPLIPQRVVDDLPPFTSLKNEADREQKALWHRPGRFGVHTIPSTFRGLPEYRDDSEEAPSEPPGRRGSSSRNPASRHDSHSPERTPRAIGDEDVLLERLESPLEKPPPTLEPPLRYQRPPDAYYPVQYSQPPQQQSYTSYTPLQHRPQPVEMTYHYQTGAFAPPPHPPQFPAQYQYAQAGISSPYPQQPARPYDERPPPLQPIHYGASPVSPIHHTPQSATTTYSPHQYSTQGYGEAVLPVRQTSAPRQAPSLPQLPPYLPPAPSMYDTAVQPRHYGRPRHEVQQMGMQQGGTMLGPAAGVGLEQYAMSNSSGYPQQGRYGPQGYYEGENGPEQ